VEGYGKKFSAKFSNRGPDQVPNKVNGKKNDWWSQSMSWQAKV